LSSPHLEEAFGFGGPVHGGALQAFRDVAFHGEFVEQPVQGRAALVEVLGELADLGRSGLEQADVQFGVFDG
jgi:hypothetical protein